MCWVFTSLLSSNAVIKEDNRSSYTFYLFDREHIKHIPKKSLFYEFDDVPNFSSPLPKSSKRTFY